jgi:hypothetical protein
MVLKQKLDNPELVRSIIEKWPFVSKSDYGYINEDYAGDDKSGNEIYRKYISFSINNSSIRFFYPSIMVHCPGFNYAYTLSAYHDIIFDSPEESPYPVNILFGLKCGGLTIQLTDAGTMKNPGRENGTIGQVMMYRTPKEDDADDSNSTDQPRP